MKFTEEQIKKAADELAVRNEAGLGLFVKQPEPLQKDNTYRYQHEPEDLLEALAQIADRGQRKLPPPVSNFAGIVGAEPYPVTKKAGEVLRKLLSYGVMKFKSLFRGSKSRSEVVATFLAVLELCKLKSVSIDQNESGETDVTYLMTPEGEVQTEIR